MCLHPFDAVFSSFRADMIFLDDFDVFSSFPDALRVRFTYDLLMLYKEGLSYWNLLIGPESDIDKYC